MKGIDFIKLRQYKINYTEHKRCEHLHVYKIEQISKI